MSPITVISLKAIDLNNRGWNVVTPSDRMLSIILAESEHLDNLGGTSALRYKVLACSEVVSLPVAEGVASLHPRLLKLSPPATILYAVNKPISSTGDNRYIVPFVIHQPLVIVLRLLRSSIDEPFFSATCAPSIVSDIAIS